MNKCQKDVIISRYLNSLLDIHKNDYQWDWSIDHYQWLEDAVKAVGSITFTYIMKDFYEKHPECKEFCHGKSLH